MAYGLIRVRNISAGDLRGTEIHNFRQYEKLGIEKPENLKDATQAQIDNTFSKLYDDEGLPIYADGGMVDNLKHKLDKLGIKPRSNSVLAIEYAVSASSEFFKKADYSWDTFLDKAAQFVAEKHGWENVVSVSMHYDESNPHAHIVALPIVEKSVKWKNQKGSGERTEKRLCARDFTGGPEKLVKLQDEYHDFCKQFERNGVKFYRGTKANEELKHYTKRTNHEIGDLRNQILALEDLVKLKEKQLEIEAKKAEMIKTTTELQQKIEIKKEQNGKNENWKKKRDFGIGF
jgi:hypothetical protein